jgi:hypothetical protein
MRTSRRRRHQIEEQETTELLESVVDPRPDAGQQLVAEERRRAVAEALDRLPEETREVVTLFYREGQSTAQVASLLDVSEVAVRQRLSRARLRLRDELLDCLGHDLIESAPGNAFVAGVATALALGAPAAASAATIGAVGAKGIGPLAKVIIMLSGTALGAAGGAFGVVLGVRYLERTAYDEEERRQLRRFKLAGVVAAIAGALGLTAALRLTHSATGPIVVFGLFVALLMGLNEIWLPRILSRRHDAEMRADPIRARTARRREQIQRAIAWTLAILGGGAALLFSLGLAGFW